MIEFYSIILIFVAILLSIIPVMVIAFWPEKYKIIRKTHRKIFNIGRNDLCPCGSGKKYKNCHIDSTDGLYQVDRWHIPRKG